MATGWLRNRSCSGLASSQFSQFSSTPAEWHAQGGVNALPRMFLHGAAPQVQGFQKRWVSVVCLASCPGRSQHTAQQTTRATQFPLLMRTCYCTPSRTCSQALGTSPPPFSAPLNPMKVGSAQDSKPNVLKMQGPCLAASPRAGFFQVIWGPATKGMPNQRLVGMQIWTIPKCSRVSGKTCQPPNTQALGIFQVLFPKGDSPNPEPYS